MKRQNKIKETVFETTYSNDRLIFFSIQIEWSNNEIHRQGQSLLLIPQSHDPKIYLQQCQKFPHQMLASKQLLDP